MKKAFKPVSDSQSKVLILGTMPGERSLLLQQYYAHRGNQFWKIMFSLFNEPFTEDYLVRQRLLLSNNIALWDVLEYCDRDGSSDTMIKNGIPNDFAGFYDKHPKIKHVFFSSGKARSLYKDERISSPSYLTFGLLPSPSSMNTSKSFDEKLNDWRVILNILKR